jgi:DNA polymerase epsilon subunit 1
LTIKGLVCEECCSVRDLDLCRDSDLLPPIEATVNAMDAAGLQQLQSLLPKWRCQACNAPFDRLRIEERLVSKVQKYLVKWCTQDLKCAKCKRLRVNEFMEHCACAGEWVGTVSKADIESRLEGMAGIAKWYGLGMLGDVVREMRQGL